MKLNKETLKRIIKEELDNVLGESRLLDRYTKDKEEELKQTFRAMGKDPDETIAALGPDSANMMGQSLIDDYPKRMKVPMTRVRRIQKASDEMEKLETGSATVSFTRVNLNDFYDPDSSGTSVFSRVLKLLPELEQIPRVKRAITVAGGDPLKVTAKIGRRVTYSQIGRKIRSLLSSLDEPYQSLEKYK